MVVGKTRSCSINHEVSSVCMPEGKRWHTNQSQSFHHNLPLNVFVTWGVMSCIGQPRKLEECQVFQTKDQRQRNVAVEHTMRDIVPPIETEKPKRSQVVSRCKHEIPCFCTHQRLRTWISWTRKRDNRPQLLQRYYHRSWSKAILTILPEAPEGWYIVSQFLIAE